MSSPMLETHWSFGSMVCQNHNPGSVPRYWLPACCAALAVAAWIFPGLSEFSLISAFAWTFTVATLAAAAWGFAGLLLPGECLQLRVIASVLMFQVGGTTAVVGLGLAGVLSFPGVLAIVAA